MTMLSGQKALRRRSEPRTAALAELRLPYPPPASKCFRPVTVWSKKQGKHVTTMVKTDRYIAWQQLAISRTVPPPPLVPGVVSAVLSAMPPSRQARDLDNLLKATFDFLKLRGVIEDDSRIHKFSFEWVEGAEPGVSVMVMPMRARIAA